MSRFYLAKHKEQRNTGPMSTTNCAAASGAMLDDQATLGIHNPSVRWWRKQTDDFKGGLRMEQVAAVLEDRGIKVHLFDHRDNLKWWRLKQYLAAGRFAVVAGDYDVLPPNLKGALYDDFHAVVYHQLFNVNIRVGDPLQEDWLKWPLGLAEQYVKKFDRQTTGGIYACVMVPEYARLRDGILDAEIVSEPEKDATVVGTIKRKQRLVTGGNVKGDTVAGNNRWRKVWVPGKDSTIGYIPWSQTWVQ